MKSTIIGLIIGVAAGEALVWVAQGGFQHNIGHAIMLGFGAVFGAMIGFFYEEFGGKP